jgi:hypothetical protein
MTMQTHNTDVAILNMEPGDEVLHGNVLMVYEDQQDSPSCTAAVVGHLLRFADQVAVPFESGTLITTVPFRIETSRLGKPVEQVTHDDLASLKAKYQLRPDTPFTMVLRKDVTAPPEQLFAHDIQHYAKTYYENRIADIETAFLAAEAQAQSLKVQPESPVCLLFGLEGLPLPVESAVFELKIADFASPFGKAYALLWHLVRRRDYTAKLSNGRHIGSDGRAALTLRLHPKHDGSFCLGLEAKNPLMLLTENSELAHFHRVASHEAAAREVCRILAELITKQFNAEVSIIVAETTSGHPAKESRSQSP